MLNPTDLTPPWTSTADGSRPKIGARVWVWGDNGNGPFTTLARLDAHDGYDFWVDLETCDAYGDPWTYDLSVIKGFIELREPPQQESGE